jgi:hypothetical protein
MWKQRRRPGRKLETAMLLAWSQLTSLNMFSAPTKTMTIGRIPLVKMSLAIRNAPVSSPWYHRDTKPPDCTYADTCNGADDDLHDASKGNTEARMYGVHPPHATREVDEDHEVGHV